MIIAVTSNGDQGENSEVSHHFGRCPFFTLVKVEGDQPVEFQVLPNPFYVSHQPGQVPEFIKGQHAEVMVSGGVGRRAGGFLTNLASKWRQAPAALSIKR